MDEDNDVVMITFVKKSHKKELKTELPLMHTFGAMMTVLRQNMRSNWNYNKEFELFDTKNTKISEIGQFSPSQIVRVVSKKNQPQAAITNNSSLKSEPSPRQIAKKCLSLLKSIEAMDSGQILIDRTSLDFQFIDISQNASAKYAIASNKTQMFVAITTLTPTKSSGFVMDAGKSPQSRIKKIFIYRYLS